MRVGDGVFTPFDPLSVDDDFRWRFRSLFGTPTNSGRSASNVSNGCFAKKKWFIEGRKLRKMWGFRRASHQDMTQSKIPWIYSLSKLNLVMQSLMN